MLKPVSKGQLTNAEISELSNLVGIRPSYRTDLQESILAKAIDQGYAQIDGRMLTTAGRQRVQRANSIPETDDDFGGKFGIGGASAYIFRKNDFTSYEDASNNGALYSFMLPEGRKTKISMLKILYDVAQQTAFSLNGNEKTFDVVLHSDLTRISTNITKSLDNLSLANETIESAVTRIRDIEKSHNDGFFMVTINSDEPTILDFATSHQNMSLKELPVPMYLFDDKMTKEKWRLLNSIEHAAKLSANCVTGFPGISVAFGVKKTSSPNIQYITMSDMKEAYTLLNITNNVDDDGYAGQSLLDACRLAIQLRSRKLAVELPAHIVDFTNKAVECMSILSQVDYSPTGTESWPVDWLSMLNSIADRAPLELGEQANDFLQQTISLPIYMEMHTKQHDRTEMTRLQQEQKSLLLEAFDIKLNGDIKSPAQKMSEEGISPTINPRPARPSI